MTGDDLDRIETGIETMLADSRPWWARLVIAALKIDAAIAEAVRPSRWGY